MAAATKRKPSPPQTASIDKATAEAIQLVANADAALAALKATVVGLKGHLDGAQSNHRDEVTAHTATSEELEGKLQQLDKESRSALAAAHETASLQIRELKDKIRDLTHAHDLKVSEMEREAQEERFAAADKFTRLQVNFDLAAEKLRKVGATLA